MPRVLIIDDDETFSDLLAALLTAEGHEAFVAGGARTALDLLRLNLEPDLVLVDLQMERMNGFETIDLLKAEPACRGAVLVMLTATGGDQAAQEARARGASGFLAKPIQPAVFGRQIARFLQDPALVWLDDHHSIVRAA